MADLNRIGPYEITGKLGEGGMGIVYRAHDTRLDRPVAVKVIRDSGDEQSRKRFIREAQAAARVSHPNICRIYDIGEERDQPFLVMELLEGSSLAQRLDSGPITVRESVQIALSILSALAALHRCGIVHRDLKPSNVFVSTEGVKLLDFGLAKPLEEDQGRTKTELTQQGMLALTPRYASPEQVTCKPVDFRTDLFSTSAVLFEMIAGRPAFPGATPIEIFHGILHESPPTLTGSSMVGAVDRVVQRALAKSPEDRFPGADSMAADLRNALRHDDTGQHVELRSVKRLIVLPFRVLRPDPDIDFLAFSLPEALAAALAGVSSLIVRSSLAAASFATDTPDLKQIAKEADVDVVLTGTLLRSNTQLRLTTQLVEAPGGTLVWSKASQVELGDIFQLQDMLVSGVVESLALPLTAGDRRQLSQHAPANATVYDLYLRGTELCRDRERIPDAIKLFEQCVARDPEYAPAWTQLGRCLWLSDKYTAGSAEKLAEAHSALQRALELNPDLAQAHNFYTHVQVEEGQALSALKRVLKRAHSSRNDPELFAGLAHACRYCGLLDAALACHRRARRLDPNISTSVMHTHFMLGDYQSALDESHADFGYAPVIALTMLGRVEEALKTISARIPPPSARLGWLYMISLRALLEGNREESLRVSDELLAATLRDPEGWYYLARQLCYLKDPDRALAALSRAVDWGFFCYPAMVRDPWLDPLRLHQGFEQILGKAEALHREAVKVFTSERGESLLDMAP